MQKTLSAFPLKVIAIAAMLLNHIACGSFGFEHTNYGFYMLGFVLGKLTYPIMAYLVVEGYRHTSNFKRYALRLAAFALLSSFPFWWYFRSHRSFDVLELFNNIMFTLLVGLLALYFTDKAENGVLRFFIVLFFTIATIASDWSLGGVLMMYGFYRIRHPVAKIFVPLAYTFVMMGGLMLLGASGMAMMGQEQAARLALWDALGFAGVFLPGFLLLLYNGQRGYSPPWVKWGFYAFYPVHLLVLGAVYHFGSFI